MNFNFFKQAGLALIETVITHVARKKNARSLRFSPATALSVPRRIGNTPTLLYMHVPFCDELCPYCSFNRVEFQEGLARRYFDALRKEIVMYRDLGYDFKALYVGGGTPTILVDELASAIRVVKDNYDVTEISVETNPNHLTRKNFALLKKIGVDRLSVGVQTFDDDLLKAIKRYHKYGSGKEIAKRLKQTLGIFHTLNVDMMFNFPMQTMGMLENDLSTICSLGVDQITYYPLMASSQTQRAMNKDLGAIDYKRGRECYEKITEVLSSRYRPTTAWCFSKKNAEIIDEYVVNFEEYAGLGSGSIGHLGGSAYANTFDIEEYIATVNKGVLPIAAKKDFSLQERLSYDFLMKLFGLSLDLSSLDAKHGVHSYRYLWPEILFFRLVKGLTGNSSRLSLTKRGQYYWLLMMREFFIGVNNFRDYCRAQMINSKDRI